MLNAVTVFCQESKLGKIEGEVVDAETGHPIEGSTVVLVGTRLGASTKSDGTFSIQLIPTGVYDVSCSAVGHETVIKKRVEVSDSTPVSLEFKLTPRPIRMSEVVVSPSSFSFSTGREFTHQMSFQELKMLPNPTDDIFRSVQVLAGVSSDNLNAQFSVRGADLGEMLTVIDGIEVYDPFHMKRPFGADLQMDGAISIINPELVESADLSLGGFSARYGNKDAGVFVINMMDPRGDSLHGNLNLDLATFGLTLAKTFGNQGFLVSARRGNFDMLMKLLGYGTNGIPSYYDFFAKYVYQPSSTDKIFLDVLHSQDNMKLWDYDTGIPNTWINNYVTYAWAGWKHTGESFASQTYLFGSVVPSNFDWNNSESYGVKLGNEQEVSYAVGLKSDFQFDLSENTLLEAGIEARRSRNTLTYFQSIQDTSYVPPEYDTARTNLLISGYDFSLYLLYKFGLFSGLASFDFGLRFDYQSYIQTGNEQVSPRIGAAFKFPLKTILRLAYGSYYQPPDVTNLESLNPDLKVAEATHYVIGFDNSWFKDINIRLEGYYKRLSPSSDSIYSYLNYFHLKYGFSQGVDLIVRYNISPFTFWGNYSYGISKDVSAEGIEFYRDMDRRQSFSFVGNYESGDWNFSAVVRYTTGLPYTSSYWIFSKVSDGYRWIYGSSEYNVVRADPFSEVDVRVTKTFAMPYGRLLVKLEIMNLLNSRSLFEQRWTWSKTDGGVIPVKDNFYTLPLIPSFGVRWEF